MIVYSTSENEIGRVVIELDGHDFHEKTKSQVPRDKMRERALINSGATVLRFSGSEVFRNPRACVEEVVSFIKEQKKITAISKTGQTTFYLRELRNRLTRP